MPGEPDLDLKDLRTLTELYAHGSLSAAAESLGMTVSALSHRLADLERRLGAPLTERRGQGLRLTERALALMPYAQAVLADVQRLSAAWAAAPTVRRIGVARLLAQGRTGAFLADVVGEANAASDRSIRWQIRVGNSREVESWVLARSVDVGLVRVGGSRAGLRFAALGEDPLVAVAAPELVERAAGDFARMPWAEIALHTGHGRAVDPELRRAGVRLPVWVETDSLEWAHTLARRGGVAVVLPHSVVAGDLATGRLIAVRVPGVLWPGRQIALVWRADGDPQAWTADWAARLRHRLADEARGPVGDVQSQGKPSV